MANTSESAVSSSSVKTTRRYWRQAATPRPWWPWGIAPLLGLGLLFIFGALFMAPRIEAEVRTQVAERIDGSGLVATDIVSDGQGIAIGTTADPDEELYVQALAKSTQCDTWVGELTCPTTVSVRRVVSQAAPAVLNARPHPFLVEKDGNAVTLTGEVPNLEEHDRILGVAGQHFTDVTNALSITNERADAQFGPAAANALALASSLQRGKANWSGTTLSVEGVAQADAVDGMRQQFAAIGSDTMQGEFNVRSLYGRERCNSDFNEVLSSTSIRFRTSSAEIDAGNEALLARLSELANNCPGKLMIEGHTDSRGDADMNEALSLARAAAVREALARLGISADRIEARGFGESSPIADNDTSEGRAKNRRIVISIEAIDQSS
ncbi:MAG: OmpA family protein [Woeseiaceae bacterium]|nr:OmpA family protein [Woeseiaceae bacterium]